MRFEIEIFFFVVLSFEKISESININVNKIENFSFFCFNDLSENDDKNDHDDDDDDDENDNRDDKNNDQNDDQNDNDDE